MTDQLTPQIFNFYVDYAAKSNSAGSSASSAKFSNSGLTGVSHLDFNNFESRFNSPGLVVKIPQPVNLKFS